MRIVLELNDYFIATFLSLSFNCFCKQFYKWVKIKNRMNEVDKKSDEIIMTPDMRQLMQ